MSDEKPKRMALIASKGSLDMTYPPLMLASTAAAMDFETMIFYTLYDVDIVNKHKYANLKVAPIANPAMPSPVPMPNKYYWYAARYDRFGNHDDEIHDGENQVAVHPRNG